MIANKLFPEINKKPSDIIDLYKKRPNNINITRIAPSPTGFLHIGAIYSSLLDLIFAKKNNGIFFLRIEDTDQKREIKGASKMYIETFKKFGINFDEGPIGNNLKDIGDYGPYIQSQREEIYKVFIKDLLEKGLAYPCFLTEEEIENTRQMQEKTKQPIGIYNKYSPWRYAKEEEILKALEEKKEFVIRFKSNGNYFNKIEVNDLIKGKIKTQENFLDIVICKKNGIPTYHFAHLIDDYLMGTTHVIRGDEWFASMPLHLQLFQTMGWNPPSYSHYGPLIKIDGNSKRKLSKRKDIEADANFYLQEGYLIEGIIDFLSNIINSGFEDWRKENINKNFLDYDFKFEKINTSGALVDLDKLNHVNQLCIKNMEIGLLYSKLETYLKDFKNEFYVNVFSKYPTDYNKKILKELKSKIKKFDEYIKETTFLYNDFEVNNTITDILINPKMKIDNLELVKKGLNLTIDLLTQKNSDFETIDEIKNLFVENIKQAGLKNGQVLWPVRVSLSGKEFSIGALELIFILGIKKSIQRLKNILKKI